MQTDNVRSIFPFKFLSNSVKSIRCGIHNRPVISKLTKRELMSSSRVLRLNCYFSPSKIEKLFNSVQHVLYDGRIQFGIC